MKPPVDYILLKCYKPNQEILEILEFYNLEFRILAQVLCESV